MKRGGGGWSAGKTIAVGTLLCGTLDLAEALAYSALRGVRPERVLHFIASGAVGRSAFGGGVATAVLGAAVHFALAAFWVGLFVVAVRRVSSAGAAVFAGLAYGLLVYAVMNLLVLPHTQVVQRGHPSGLALMNGLFALMVCFGLPLALLCRRVLR